MLGAGSDANDMNIEKTKSLTLTKSLLREREI